MKTPEEWAGAIMKSTSMVNVIREIKAEVRNAALDEAIKACNDTTMAAGYERMCIEAVEKLKTKED